MNISTLLRSGKLLTFVEECTELLVTCTLNDALWKISLVPVFSVMYFEILLPSSVSNISYVGKTISDLSLPNIFKLFYRCSITVVCVYSPPLTPTPAKPSSLPCFHPTLVLSMCLLWLFLKTLPPFPPINPSHLPSGYCQIVFNFNVSGYILLAFLFCWLGST